MPADLRALIFLLLIPFAATPAEKPPTPDIDLLEFLGSLETDKASGTEVLTAIDTELLTRHDCSCTEAGPNVAAEQA